MFCNTNQLPSFPFGGPHTKLNGVKGLNKNYHMRFDPKLGHGICSILCITCACAEYKSMLDKPWIHGLTPSNSKNRANTLSHVSLTGQL